MRALKYRLENGTVVNSMPQAKASGQKYEVFLEEIRETNRENISPIRKAMLEQFGYVHPSLKDKVVLDQRQRPLNRGVFFMPKLNAPRAALASGILLYHTRLVFVKSKSAEKLHKILSQNLCNLLLVFWEKIDYNK